jgi:hypothetical protein
MKETHLRLTGNRYACLSVDTEDLELIDNVPVLLIPEHAHVIDVSPLPRSHTSKVPKWERKLPQSLTIAATPMK